MKHSDQQRVNKIYEYASKLTEYVRNNDITREALMTDFSLQWLVTTPLYNIGEHAYNLSAEYKAEHDEIPWSMISGLRHRLVHDYDGTNWEMISEVVFDDIPELLIQLEKRGRRVIYGEFAHRRSLMQRRMTDEGRIDQRSAPTNVAVYGQ